MAKKKKKSKVDGMGLPKLEKAMKSMDVQGVAVVVLSTDGQIMIGSEGLDHDTCQSLLAQSANLMRNESDINFTLH